MSLAFRFCCLAIYAISLTLRVDCLTVGAFNIQHYSDSKQNEWGGYIVKVLKHFDVVLVQEVRDVDHSALDDLKTLLGSRSWDYVSSGPIGRTSAYKEQYVYFYRKSSVRVLGSFQYDDSVSDVFEREPYAIEIQYASSVQGRAVNVVLLGIHTQPEMALEELQALPAAMTAAKTYFSNSSGVVALGDYNADCSYLNSQERATLPLFNEARYQSLISDSIDTTTSTSTDCAYDRIVVDGNIDVIVGSAKVFRFDSALGLDNNSTRAISDHYPIECILT
ncbi:unnamed protein product [Lymnaea stagnalis]|uniref:Deoxyribonuclease n=1 Tax=Lymnaea stagnalis TaxID=6523 RepID=A0AAV2HDZ7_LYMST